MALPETRERIEVYRGDITQVEADAIVTAANEQLRGGGGVDGAVHRAAGPKLLEASLAEAPCPAGEARLTPAFELDAQYVIHAVGPVYAARPEDPAILASAYQSSLELAEKHAIARIAFPALSTGVYGYPKQEACDIALRTVVDWLDNHQKPEKVIFCCYDEADVARYAGAVGALGDDAG